MNELYKKLFETHERYREKTLEKRRFKHKTLKTLIETLPFEKKVAGFSFEHREIYQINLGKGKTKVMLWSQMHGDEATATMALFDIFRFFETQNDEFSSFKNAILENLQLCFIPMLNPDGAERFQRRTATDIDMNRDALALQTPEGRLLKELQHAIRPHFSFNLHDKNTRYSAGNSPFQATISFLATAYNATKDWNNNRTEAMRVIGAMSETLAQFIPNRIGRWNDDFEPRAFGDQIQSWGSSLILIESGGYLDDTEKQFIRKLNFVAILTALHKIATNDLAHYSMKMYEQLPENSRSLFDVLIRGGSFVHSQQKIQKDIGINLAEKNNAEATDFSLSSVIEDMGDLSTFWGIKEIDAEGMEIESFDNFPELKETYKIESSEIAFEGSANFLITKQKKVQFVVVNGAIHSVANS